MGTLHAEWEGLDKLVEALDVMTARIDVASRTTTSTVLKRVDRQMRTLLSAGQHPPGTPTGSPPGSPPWRISGHLRDTSRVEGPFALGMHAWWGRTGPTAEYGRIQELGGVTGRHHATRLPPRPYLYPAWRIVRPTVRDAFIRGWAAAVRNA